MNLPSSEYKEPFKEWNDLPMKEWDTLPLNIYKIMLEEIKELFGEYTSETESVTDKSIKMLTGVSIFISAAGGIILSKVSINIVNIILVIGFGILLFRLYSIIKSRQGQLRGMNPSNYLTNDFDKVTLTEEDKEKLAYLNLIEQYMRKVYTTRKLNKERAKEYDINFFLTIFLIIATSLYIGAIS